ncbi:MAG: tetratricopeptide repeat protein [Planctomycetota bacterium]
MRTLALLLLAAAARAQDVQDLVERYLAQQEEAFVHYRAKDFEKAVAAFERQIATFAENPGPYYNIACCYALEGDADRAATWLALSIERGWRDAVHLARDPDFDGVRQSAGYIACLAQLKRARERDPDPMPQVVPAPEAPPPPLTEEAVRVRRILYGEHACRKWLFDVYDRRMAVLARYLVENGDTAHAGVAAHMRVVTAAAYLEEAEGQGEPDRALREVAATYVLRTAEEFLRHWPGDKRLPEVLLLRAGALAALGREAEAIALLRTIRADHPAYALNADAALCELLPPGEELKRAYGSVKDQVKRAPVRARLLCEGMPDVLVLDVVVSERLARHEGLIAYVYVASGDMESERLLKELPTSDRLLPIVVRIDDSEEAAPWLTKHASSHWIVDGRAIDGLRVPAVVVAKKDGTVVAVNPDAAELARLSR